MIKTNKEHEANSKLKSKQKNDAYRVSSSRSPKRVLNHDNDMNNDKNSNDNGNSNGLNIKLSVGNGQINVNTGFKQSCFISW